MADSEGRPGMFAAISVVSLVFMVIGIAIAVVQWVSYAADLPPGPRTTPAAPSLSSHIGSAESSGDDGVGAGAGTSRPADEKPKAGTGGAEVKPPVGDDGIEF
ncbi:MAG: hypothetical protein ABIF82_05000 [Planctomycetota bacterium]